MAYINAYKIENIDNKYVKVGVSSKKFPEVQYKLPKDKADEFCIKYPKFINRTDLFANVSFFAIIMAITGLISKLTRNLKNFVRFTSIGVGAIGMGIVAAKIMSPMQENKYNKFLAKYQAEEIPQTPKAT